MDYIYADNAATTRMSETALRVMTEALRTVYGNPSSLHMPGQEAAMKLQEARNITAACIGAGPQEIYFTSGGSESDNQAILTAAAWGRSRGKRHMIASRIEHHAVLRALEHMERQGFEITLLDVDERGFVSVSQVENAIREDTALVSVMFANNEIGTIEPVKEIGAVCRRKGVLFHTDAVQAAGHEKIDVKAQQIDMLSLSAHKFHGPKGAGALYIRKGIPAASLIEGGGQERGKRAGTENVPAILSMAAALKEACSHMEENRLYVSELRDRLIGSLEQIPGARLNGSRDRRLAGNISFCFDGVEGESLLLNLDARRIAASSGAACSAGALEPSHVLLALGLSPREARGSLRLSLCETNTREETDRIAAAVAECVLRLRRMSQDFS